MEKSIGERLRDERKKQGLSIEDVAHATRIHANTVLGLEADDYSGFASTTYAKSFLKKYAAHLGVDASDALARFSSDATSPIVGGANYIRSVADSIETVERISGLSDSGHFAHVGSEPGKKRRRNNAGGHPVVLGLFLVLLLTAVGILIKIGHQAETPEEARRNWQEFIGSDDSGEAETKSSAAAAEVDASPGTRISPAAPMTRPAKPEPEPSTTVVNDDPQPPFMGPPLKPLAQADVAKPAKVVAKPVVRATPVVLPTEGDDENAEANNAEPNGDTPESGTEPESDTTSENETAQN